MTSAEHTALDTLFEAIISMKPVSYVFQYCCDQRNTDNAWIEATVLGIHDATGMLLKMVQKGFIDD